MKYPFLEVPSTSVSRTEEFGGINKNIRIGEAEFSDTKNMSCEEYPLISTRRKRTALSATTERAKGIIAKDDARFMAEESNGETLKLTVKESVPAEEKPIPPDGIKELVYDPKITAESDSGFDGERSIYLYRTEDSKRFRFNCTEIVQGNIYTFVPTDDEGDIKTGDTMYELTNNYCTSSTFTHDTDDTLTGKMPGFQKNGGYLYAGTCYSPGLHEMAFPLRVFLKSVDVEIQKTDSTVRKEVRKNTFIDCYGFTESTVYDLQNGTVYFLKFKFSDLTDDAPGTVKSVVLKSLRIGYNLYSVTNGCRWSFPEYKSQVAENEEAYKQALEQYEKDCRTEIFVKESISSDVARALREYASTGGKALSVESVKDNSIIIQKPHGAINEGAFIDTEKEYISFRRRTKETDETGVIGITDEKGERHIVPMGAYAVIFPDNFIVNTLYTDENGKYTDVKRIDYAERCYIKTDANLSVHVLLCNSEYEPIPNPKVGQSAPSGEANGEYWIDTSGKEPILKVYSTVTSMWSRAEAFLKICSFNITQGGTEKGDSIKIIDKEGKEWLPQEISFPDGKKSHIVYQNGVMTMPEGLREKYGKLERGYIVIEGCLKNGGVYALEADGENDYIEIKRTIPKMDHIIESCNRLFGCYYGEDENGRIVNEIYACKLGDPANWNCFEGVSTDSYTATLGSDGEFTGSAVFENTPVFFKENCIHRVFGSYPENYQIITQNFPGIEKGSEKSAATVNGILFYKAQDGIYGYDGAASVKVSDKLKERCKNAIGGSYDGVYYVSMEDEKGERWLFTYDVGRGIWHRQDNVPVKRLLNYGRDLLINTDDGRLLSVDGLSGEKESDFDFLLRSGEIGYSISGKKYITKITLQMILESKTRVYVDIRYDGKGDFENVLTTQGGGSRSIHLPIRPRRCERFEIKIYGKGGFKLISVEKTLRKGSDVR